MGTPCITWREVGGWCPHRLDKHASLQSCSMCSACLPSSSTPCLSGRCLPMAIGAKRTRLLMANPCEPAVYCSSRAVGNLVRLARTGPQLAWEFMVMSWKWGGGGRGGGGRGGGLTHYPIGSPCRWQVPSRT